MVNNSQIILDQLAVFSATQEIGIRNLYALLVGIDKYKAPGNNLNGCVNDIEEVEKFIKNRLNFNSHIAKLLNEQATRQNVIKNFESHLCKASKDDVVLFYFCGHGAQEEAGQELHFLEYEKEPGKKKLETIVCHDSRTLSENGTEIRDLADKELRYLIAKVAKNEPHILVVFDCCHSSSGTRDTDRKEGVRRTDSRPPRAYEEFCFAHDPQIKQDLKNRKFPEGKHVFISACLHTETAKEITDLERGVFSYFLLKELNSLNATLSYNDLLREVSARVHGYRRDQTPQVEPIGMTSEELNEMSFLGDKDVIKPRDPYFILSRREEKFNKEEQLIQEAEWVINGGAFLHLQKGSKLAVYREHSTADEMKNDQYKIGEIQITTVRVTESVVKFTSKPEPQGSIFYAVLTERQLPSVSFYLEGDANVLEQVKALLKDSPFVGIESDRHQTHHYRLYADKQQFRITDANDRLLVQPIEGHDVNLAVKQVEHIARWRKTREMENPSTTIPKDAIEIEIWHNGERLKDPHPRLEYQYNDGIWEEPIIQLKLKNTCKRSLYCTILDIADDYSVSFPGILPEGGTERSWIQLQPGQEYWATVKYNDGSESQDIPLGIPPKIVGKGVTEYKDLFKLVASTTQFNSSDFLQGSLLVAEPSDRQVILEQKLPNDDWITQQFSFTYVRPKDSVKLTPEAETVLSSGITIKAPSGLSASARFKTTKSATRSMSSMVLPSLLEETETFQFTNSRSLEQGLDVLELQIDTSTINAVKPGSPMIISVDQPLQPNERILAVAHDGQFYFPLGIGQAENDKTEIKIEYLCDPQQLNSDEREISQAIQLCFRKVVLDNLGRKSSYAWLRKATVNRDGTVSYTDKGDVDTVKAAVAKAKNIVLYIHGIIGDTESMIPSMRHAKANVNEQLKSVEELYDLVLGFDYESLNTPIEETAKILKNQLAAIGLEPNHGKTLHIVAHSMGGLVSRSFIEQENGNEVVSHLVMVGTPNGGSPWATVHDLATTLLSFGLNFSYVPLVPSLLKKLVEAMSVTLREMHSTKSSFFSELKTSVSSRCPYSVIAGSTALMNQVADRKNLLNALKNKLLRAIEFPFGDEENDIAVAVSSIIDVPQDGSSTVHILETIACDHLSYFRQAEGLKAIARAISQAFGYPPEPLPPSSSSSPSGPRPNPSPASSGKTGAQPTEKSSKNTSKERTSGSSASSGTKSSISANTLQSQTPSSSAQKTASVSPQINPNHETRTTKWFDTTHVVAIGINNYTRPIAKLENAVSDAEKICELFSEKSLLSREPVKHYKLLDEQATLNGIRQNLNSLKTEVKKSDRLILYFAGHGIALPMEIVANAPSNKPQGYLIPQDAKYGEKTTYLSMFEFIQSLSDIQCRHCLIILDCCYAGAIKWSLGQDRQVLHQKVFPSVLDLYIDSHAWQILTSAAEDQTANDGFPEHKLKENNRNSNGKSNSPFVSFLEKGLGGEADTYPRKQNGKSGDGIITIDELTVYLRNEVEQSTNELERLTNGFQKRQTPALFTLYEKHQRGQFVFLLGDFAEVRNGLGEDPNISDQDNPYRGLESYTEHDGAVFFGREKLIEKLSERVQNDPFTIVLGQSGAGKSSLVQAGLVPKLRKISEEIERSQQLNSEEKTTQQSESKAPPVKWVAEIFRPGQLPATALEEALEALEEAVKKLEPSNIPDNTKRLLVIDQFEEIETQCRDEEEKNNFWKKLIKQLKNSSNKLHLVFTLRSDFEPSLRSKFEDAIKKFDSKKDIDWVSARFIVTDMEREELQDAIEKPAKEKAVFFTLDPNPDKEKPSSRTLVQELVEEVVGMPGALPLLSFALYTIYHNFVERYVEAGVVIKREITWDDYRDSLGGEGVPGSLTKRATEEYEQLPTDNHRAMLRRVMLRMISLQGGELARRQVPKWELKYPSPEENDFVTTVIQRFSEARLIIEDSNSQGEPYVEPAHDALVKGWSKLQEWIEQEQGNLVLQRRLVESTLYWSSQGCTQDSPFLWNQDIAGIEQLKEMAKSDKYWLNELELRFFEVSEKLRDRLKEKEKNLIKEKSENLISMFTEMARIEFISNNKLRSLIPLIRAGYFIKEMADIEEMADIVTYEAKFKFLAMFGQILDEIQELNSFDGHKDWVLSVSFSPDNTSIASVGLDKTIKIWNFDGSLIQNIHQVHEDWITSIAFSPNGEFMASSSYDNSIIVWEKKQNEKFEYEWKLKVKIEAHKDSVKGISFSYNSQIIASASEDKTIKIWDIDGNLQRELGVDKGHTEGVTHVSFSPDDRIIASSSRDKTVKIWDTSTGKLLKTFSEHKDIVSAVSFSPVDNNILISSSWDKTLKMWDINTKESIKTFEGHEQYVNNVAFSSDGETIASVSSDCTIKIWSKHGKLLKTLKGHKSEVIGISFSRDNSKLISSSKDKTVKCWRYKRKFEGHKNPIKSIGFNPYNSTIITTSFDNTIKIWNQKGELLKNLEEHENICDLKVSPDGKYFATVGLNSYTIQVWTCRGEKFKCFQKDEDDFTSVSFSPDSKIIALANKQAVRFWNIDLSRLEESLIHNNDEIYSQVNFSPDGRFIAAITSIETVKIWRTCNKDINQKFNHTKRVKYYTFSSNSQKIATVTENEVKLWNCEGELIQNIIIKSNSDIIAINFLDKDKKLASISRDKTVRLWCISNGELLQQFQLEEIDNFHNVNCASFNQDGNAIALGNDNSTINLWTLDLDQLLIDSCLFIEDYLKTNINITDEERKFCNFNFNMK